MREKHLARINRPLFGGKILFLCVVLIAAKTAFPQSYPIYYSNKEVYVSNLPSLTSTSADSSAVLATAVETILHDKALCCGKDSGLENAVLSAPSLRALSAQLQGRHVLGDGLSVRVRAEYVPQGAIGSALVISTLQDRQPMLIEWKSHVYVLYGATYDETEYETGTREYLIHKLLLLDVRFSDHRRQAGFNRDTDDWGTIQDILMLSVARP